MRKEHTMNTTTQNPGAVAAPTGNDTEFFVRPDVDIYDSPLAYEIHAEMPGVDRQRLEVTIDEDRLTLTGRRTQPPAGTSYLHHEMPTASFRRVFQISQEIDRERITAKVDQGVVTVTLAKVRRPEPRRIEVS
jgi:HSP20 family protein